MTSLFPWEVLTTFKIRYNKLIKLTYVEHPLPETTEKKRGRKKKGKALALAERLYALMASVCPFACIFSVPFDNNESERSIRMIKTKTEVSSCFRCNKDAQDYLKIMSHVGTAKSAASILVKPFVRLFVATPCLSSLSLLNSHGSYSSIDYFLAVGPWLVEQVDDGRTWDIKRPEKWNGTIRTTFPGVGAKVYYGGMLMNPEEMGNYTYGYIGAALGFVAEVLYAGSWYAAGKPTIGISVTTDNPVELINDFGDWPLISAGWWAYHLGK